MKSHTKYITFLSLLSTLAFISVSFIRLPLIPSAPFLKFDIRDAIILIGGILYDPFAAVIVAFIAGLMQFLLLSDGSGIVGFLMNFISTVSFVCPASFIYKFGKNYKSLVIGLILGCALMTVNMLLWNYIITPLFMGVPREAVKAMLLPVFLPFNILKGLINSVITFIFFKPLILAANAMNFYEIKKGL